MSKEIRTSKDSVGKADSSNHSNNEDAKSGSQKSVHSDTKQEDSKSSDDVKRLPSLIGAQSKKSSAGDTTGSPKGVPSIMVQKSTADDVSHRLSNQTKGSTGIGPSEFEQSSFGDDGRSGGTDLYDDFWRNYSMGDDQNLDNFFDNYYGQEEELEDLDTGTENDDTIQRSTDVNGASEDSGRMEQEQKKRSGKAEVSKEAFRWFERKILAQQIPESPENERRKLLLEKCQMLRKVSKPIVTIFGGHGDKKHLPQTSSVKHLHSPKKKSGKGSQASIPSTQEGGDEGSLPGEDDTIAQIDVPEFNEKAWAMKDTLDFLTMAGCASDDSPSYTNTKLKTAKQEAADFRLVLYEKQLQRRRDAIGSQMQAPEITASLRRAAERAIWRAVIDNTKPRYPLPRFILPRHQYLRKVQEQFLGPGSYEHDVYEKQIKARQLRLPSTWTGCSSRFPKEEDTSASTGARVLLDPWEPLEKANYKKRYPGIYVPFESTPKNYMGKALCNGSGSKVPPNAYNIKSPLEEFIKKKTGLRGPYDCYTPSRSVIPYGYFISTNPDERQRLGPGSYEIRSSLVKEMNDSYNFFKGKIGKADRYSIFGFKAAFDKPLWPHKGVTIPPPGHYDVGKDVIGSDKKQNKAPFKTSWMSNREFKRRELVAPDYYYFAGGTTWTTPPKGANLASVFHSNTPQIMTYKQNLIRKHKNRAANLTFDKEVGGHKHEVHDVPVENFKNVYALEDCQNPCWKDNSTAIKDPFAIPSYGLPGINGPNRPDKTSCGGCCR